MLLSVRFSEVVYVGVSVSVKLFMLLSVHFSEVVYVVVCPFQ